MNIELSCDVCGSTNEVKVRASSFGAISLAYCQDCLNKGLEPYSIIIAYLASGYLEFNDLSKEYKKSVKKNLDYYDKIIREFNEDIDEIIQDRGELN